MGVEQLTDHRKCHADQEREGLAAVAVSGVRCPCCATRVGGEVVRGLFATALAGACLLAASGCGSTPPAAMPTAAPTSWAGFTPAVPAGSAAGPCAGVKVTTPIDSVAPACQALWAPYGVTLVPPSNEIAMEHVPNAPPVVNMTDGAVTDATAQHWADASNWDSGWWKWAQANDQLFLLRDLVGPALIPAAEVDALQGGGSVDQPDCNLYPLTSRLFAVGAEGRAYFARKHLPTDDAYLFVVVYSGPCTETVHHAGGQDTSIVDFTEDTTVFTPGVFRSDPVLGDIWFGDAGGNCQDPLGPPAVWCSR